MQQALRRGVQQPWLVQRIVRLVPTAHGPGTRRWVPRQVDEIRHTGDASGYLLDLVAPGMNEYSRTPGA